MSRSYQFSAQRVRLTSRRQPGKIHWAVYHRNRDGSEPRYYLSNAPEDTSLETLAYVGRSRRPLFAWCDRPGTGSEGPYSADSAPLLTGCWSNWHAGPL